MVITTIVAYAETFPILLNISENLIFINIEFNKI